MRNDSPSLVTSPPTALRAAIAAAAQELNALRERWLNPPEWTRTEFLEFPASVTGPWSRYLVGPLPSAGTATDVGLGPSPGAGSPNSGSGNPAYTMGLARIHAWCPRTPTAPPGSKAAP